MKIKYKKLNERAVEPYKKHIVDAGFDLTATWIKKTDKYIEYGTDLAFEIPVGYVGLLFPRSSVRNQDLMLKNSVGVVDASYRGEIKFSFHRTEKLPNDIKLENEKSKVTVIETDIYNIGERCGQIVIMKIPDIEMIEADELSDTDRGTDGYGSSGR
ncbi:MAG: dUTP diphosphatase [Bacteroidales bacterium]|jgi:dUTP pyrophosphatase|nr:dUTP diphosphatase [Bacteroidales bacterium]